MTTQLKERPVIFTTEEVNAVLAGDKTQHRLVVGNPSNGFEFDFNLSGLTTPAIGYMNNKFGLLTKREIHPNSKKFERGIKSCPFGKVGDRLWVRETHHAPDFLHDYEVKELAEGLTTLESLGVTYKADAPHMTPADGGWCSPVGMPRWASRITLEITDIRIERVQDITLGDSLKEACNGPMDFAVYWMSKHGEGEWFINPWVWVIEFKKVDD